MDKHEQSNVVKDHKNFLRKMEELKPYMVKFNGFGVIKSKVYPPNCTIKGDNQQRVIIII